MSEKTANLIVPKEVQAFAREQGVEAYLPAVLDAAQRAFPGAEVGIELEEDHETEGLRYLVLGARQVPLSVEQALEARDNYYRHLLACVPAPRVGTFRLQLELAS